MERTYTIPLRKAYMKTSRYLRTNRAVREVRMYLKKHMKTENVKLGEELNNALWARGDAKPPHKVTVVVKKEDDVAYAELQGHEFRKKDFSEKEEKQQKTTRGVEAAPKAGTPEEQKSAEEIIGAASTAKAKADAADKKPAAKKASKK